MRARHGLLVVVVVALANLLYMFFVVVTFLFFSSVFRCLPPKYSPLQYFAREVWDDDKRRAAQEVHNRIDKFLPDDSSDGDGYDDDDDDDKSRDAYSLS